MSLNIDLYEKRFAVLTNYVFKCGRLDGFGAGKIQPEVFIMKVPAVCFQMIGPFSADRVHRRARTIDPHFLNSDSVTYRFADDSNRTGFEPIPQKPVSQNCLIRVVGFTSHDARSKSQEHIGLCSRVRTHVDH
jgi:hypothetical protein